MQERTGMLFLIVIAIFLFYNAIQPRLLIEMTVWQMKLIGLRWPIEQHRGAVRLVALLLAMLFAGGAIAMGLGYT